MDREFIIFDGEDDIPEYQINLAAVMELTGNDEIYARPLQPVVKTFCEYPGCKAFSTGPPQLRYAKVSFNRFNCYLCPDHNRCFYCKKPEADVYRLCSRCLADRENRKRFKTLPPPPKPEMTDFIKRKMGLSRDIVILICRHLIRIDQVMWAIACGSTWRRRPHYTDQACRHGTPNQALWFLRQGCLPVNRATYYVDYLRNEFCYEEAIVHIRRFHAVMEKERFWNVMASRNLLGWSFVHEKDWQTEDDPETGEKGRPDKFKFFKWNFLLLKSRSLKYSDGSSILDLILEAKEVDLLIWLKKNGCVDTFGTQHNIREADARRQEGLLKLFLAEDGGYTSKVLEKVFRVRVKQCDWDHVRFLLKCGVLLPSNLITTADWTQINTMVKTGNYLNHLWPLIELMAETKRQISEDNCCHLIKEGMVETLRKLVQLGFSFRPRALSLAVTLNLVEMAELIASTGLAFTETCILRMLEKGNLEMLKLAARYGKKFGQSDMILAQVMQHRQIVQWLDAELTSDLFAGQRPDQSLD